MNNSEHSSELVTPWSSHEQELMEKLNVDPEAGLAEIEVQQRQKKFGYNQLQIEEEKSIFEIAVNQFKSLIIILLAVSAVISFLFGDFIESVAIIVVILINAVIGFLTEFRAVRSMEALRELSEVTAKVKREGRVLEINAKEIVPGDILVINSGNVITADARLIQASKLRINEASLTGESLPVKKQTQNPCLRMLCWQSEKIWFIKERRLPAVQVKVLLLPRVWKPNWETFLHLFRNPKKKLHR
jgi:P-type Ca2+ transporter type 2C